MGLPVNRIAPKLPARRMKSYQIIAPVRTHWRKATCEEAGCLAWHNGWRTRVETLTEQQRHAVRNSGRKYTVLRVAEGETHLLFEAGTPCFRTSAHRVRVERPELYVVRRGDWRDRTGPHRRFSGGDAWVNDFGEHQDRIARAVGQ